MVKNATSDKVKIKDTTLLQAYTICCICIVVLSPPPKALNNNAEPTTCHIHCNAVAIAAQSVVHFIADFIFLFSMPSFRFTVGGSGLSSFRVAPLARQSLTRFEGVKKPPSVSLLRPFELPLVEHKGRKRVCAFLPSVATFEVSNVSEGDCFAALQIAVISTGRRPPRKRSLEWCGFLPALSFYPPSPRLWRTSLSMGLFLSLSVSTIAIGLS